VAFRAACAAASPPRHDDFDLERYQFRRQRSEAIDVALAPARFQHQVPPFDVAKRLQALPERFETNRGEGRRSRVQVTDAVRARRRFGGGGEREDRVREQCAESENQENKPPAVSRHLITLHRLTIRRFLLVFIVDLPPLRKSEPLHRVCAPRL
jgi:hypothetical protein